VPTLLLHGFLVSKVEAIVEEVDETSVRLTQAIASLGGGAARGDEPGRPKSRTMTLLEKQRV